MWYADQLGLPSLNTTDWVAHTEEMYFLTHWRLEVQAKVLTNLVSPDASPWFEAGHLLAMYPTPIICALLMFLLLTRTAMLLEQGLTLMASGSLNYLLRGPVIRYIHRGTSTYEFGGGHI